MTNKRHSIDNNIIKKQRNKEKREKGKNVVDSDNEFFKQKESGGILPTAFLYIILFNELVIFR